MSEYGSLCMILVICDPMNNFSTLLITAAQKRMQIDEIFFRRCAKVESFFAICVLIERQINGWH